MTQNNAIEKHLRKGKSLTPMQALRLFNCWALSSRVAQLNKKHGRIFKSELVTRNGKTFAKYSLK